MDRPRHPPVVWRAADATPLGVTCTPDGARFAVVAEADAVRVRLVEPGTRKVRIVALDPVRGEHLVWMATDDHDLRGWSYTYEIDRGHERLGDIVDPWARLVREGRGYIVRDATPVTPRPRLEPQDAVIYELHVRDFTRDPASGVKPEWRGKFLGVGQTGTRYEGTEVSTGLDHIIELGVNVVQLMPVHSFALPYNPEYEWGYMPNEFFAPHAG